MVLRGLSISKERIRSRRKRLSQSSGILYLKDRSQGGAVAFHRRHREVLLLSKEKQKICNLGDGMVRYGMTLI